MRAAGVESKRLTAHDEMGRIVRVRHYESKLRTGMPSFRSCFRVCIIEIDRNRFIRWRVRISCRKEEDAPKKERRKGRDRVGCYNRMTATQAKKACHL